VLLDPYAGPATQRVTAAQEPLSFVSQWFAEQGFAVLVTDGRVHPDVARGGNAPSMATCSVRS
jgi:dipeptidyl-peptidase 4